ncbi:MAG: hypothetical protein JWM18_1995 [Chloroflexi bacterium]|jgi:hypothetical protein|nr:hypothetical protein [Chloroflexota bacterium]
MRVLRILMAVPVIGLGLAATPASAAPAAASPYHAALSASEETPTAGPAGGTGAAKVTIDAAAGQLCYDLSWSPQVGTPSAAHIHKGAAGTSGPIVVVLSPTAAHTCVASPGPVLQGIAADPSGYYVNIHSNAYPGGAVRGQLQAG